MRALGFLAVVTMYACYSPAYNNCEIPCATSMVCPDGYACDGTLCRATSSSQTCDQILGDANHDSNGSGSDAIDGAAGVDTDSDMINDDVDNCIDAPNTNQADEDSDNKGDVCDPCPMFSGAGTANDDDADGDGIGNACDPRPNSNGDVRVLFEGFSGTTQPPNTTVVGMWSFANGRAVSMQSPSDLRWDLDLVPGTQKFTVRTFMHVVDTATLMTQFCGGGIVDSIPAGGFPGVGCGLGIGNSTNGLHAFTVGNNADTSLVAGPVNPPLTTTASMPIHHQRITTSESDLGCSTAGGVDVNPNNLSTQPVRGIALHARNWNVAFEYIDIIHVEAQ